jgi:hypothetical protein
MPIRRAIKHQGEISGFNRRITTAIPAKIYQLNFMLVKESNIAVH